MKYKIALFCILSGAFCFAETVSDSDVMLLDQHYDGAFSKIHNQKFASPGEMFKELDKIYSKYPEGVDYYWIKLTGYRFKEYEGMVAERVEKMDQEILKSKH